MSKKILVIAPHPDDETIGCGGILLRLKKMGASIHWIIVTSLPPTSGDRGAAENQARVIESVAKEYPFDGVVRFGISCNRLQEVPREKLVSLFEEEYIKLQPEQIFLPYRGDLHSDHSVVFDSAGACTKWFRFPSIRRVLCYETLSETDFAINPDANGFKPNLFVDISDCLERKIEILKHYALEFGDFPFPRSEKAIRALATIRGAASGFNACEAFMLLKERF